MLIKLWLKSYWVIIKLITFDFVIFFPFLFKFSRILTEIFTRDAWKKNIELYFQIQRSIIAIKSNFFTKKWNWLQGIVSYFSVFEAISGTGGGGISWWGVQVKRNPGDPKKRGLCNFKFGTIIWIVLYIYIFFFNPFALLHCKKNI